MAWFINKKEIDIIKKLLGRAQVFNSYDNALKAIISTPDKPFVISFLNMFAIQTALKNEEFFNALMQSDLLFIDGIGVKLLCKKFNLPYGVNMNGTDFIPWLISKFKDKSFLVFGSTLATVTQFKEKLSGYNILHILDGFNDYQHYIDITEEYPANVILLGMGMPKQEILSSKIKSAAVIINGGAIVDYTAGAKTRAPRIFILLNAEWVYRMFYEPKRLLKRYTDGMALMGQIYLTNTNDKKAI